MTSSELPGCRRGHGQACQLSAEPPEHAGGAVMDALTSSSSIMYGLLRWLRVLDLLLGIAATAASAVSRARQLLAENGRS